jgi:WD40 repeat protein/predicted Ser/Thr protein kinase
MHEPSPKAVEALFKQAIDLDPPRRAAFLDEHCGDDAELRAAVEELLQLDGESQTDESLFCSPVAGSRPRGLTPPLQAIGRYRVVRVLGEGGMGTVYEAEQDNPRRTVALKVIRPGLASNLLLQRFAREAQILGRLHHPGIAQVYDAGVAEGGQPYFAMELIAGVPLDQYAGEQGLDTRGRLELVARVCDAVQHAHDRGVIHRDLKPPNILVEASGQPKVLDFGVARAADLGLTTAGAPTEAGQLLGTLNYMSPEQASGDPSAIDARGDVYALGVILYELLAHRLPYSLDELPLHEAARLIHEQEPSRLGSLDSHLRGDVETIVAKALAKEKARRYASAGELAADIRHHLNHEPIRARPTSALYQLRKFARRHKALMGGVAGVLAALVVGLVGTLVFAVRAAQQRDQAEYNAQLANAKEREATYQTYRANIAAAASNLQVQDVGAARRALEDAPEHYRNWEWQHFYSQLDNARFVLRARTREMPWASQQMRVSPMGRQVAAWDETDKAIHLWDVTTGKELAILRGHEDQVLALAYSPDGKRLASGSADHTIRVWDPETSRPLAVLRGHQGPVANLVYSPDGRRILSVSFDGHGYRLWDAATGQEIAVLGGQEGELAPAAFSPDSQRVVLGLGDKVGLAETTSGKQIAILGRHENLLTFVGFSPDGKRIASFTGPEQTVHLWDAVSGKPVAVLRGHTAYIVTLAFSPDGSRLASAGNYPDNMVRLWQASTGQRLAVLTGHKNRVDSVAFSPDGQRLISASMDQTACLWDGVTGQRIAILRGHTGPVRAALFNPAGSRVVTASSDQTLRLWDAEAGELITVLRGHGGSVEGAVFTTDGKLLVSHSQDGTLRVWDMELAERNGILRGHMRYVYDVAFRPDGTQVASAAWDHSVRLWDPNTGQQTGLLRHDTDIVGSVAFSPDGRHLATVTRDDRVHLWDGVRGLPEHVFAAPTSEWRGNVRAAFNPQGTLLAVGGRDGRVRLWDLATRQPAGVLAGEAVPVWDVAFSPDGKQLAAGQADGTVRLWDVAARAPLVVLRWHKGDITRVVYSSDGRLLASASADKNVCLWDTQTRALLATLPHGSCVYGVAFNLNGSRLAAGCADNTIRLWDLARREEVAELRGHEEYVHAVAFSPDGTRLVSASGDTTVRVWDTIPAARRLGAPLPQAERAAEPR